MVSPKKYIKEKARKLPIEDCLINDDWQEKGLATIFISRKMPSGKLIVGIYLVDVFCLGLKNTYYRFNITTLDFKELYEQSPEHFISITENEAHNIIYGAIDYADELGFSPTKDFSFTEYILDDQLIDDGIDEIEFGKDGKPFFIQGPDDNTPRVLSKLEHAVGKDGFEFIAAEDDFI